MSYPYADLAMFCIPTQRKNKPATSGKLRTRTMHGLKWFKANANCWTCQYSARLCATVYMFQGIPTATIKAFRCVTARTLPGSARSMTQPAQRMTP